ncbi:MAG: hypothetical protein IKL67_05470 [Tidjanibacter sp.]|nr:hypothetical protein [Tidjanibacter sp.]
MPQKVWQRRVCGQKGNSKFKIQNFGAKGRGTKKDTPKVGRAEREFREFREVREVKEDGKDKKDRKDGYHSYHSLRSLYSLNSLKRHGHLFQYPRVLND